MFFPEDMQTSHFCTARARSHAEDYERHSVGLSSRTTEHLALTFHSPRCIFSAETGLTLPSRFLATSRLRAERKTAADGRKIITALFGDTQRTCSFPLKIQWPRSPSYTKHTVSRQVGPIRWATFASSLLQHSDVESARNVSVPEAKWHSFIMEKEQQRYCALLLPSIGLKTKTALHLLSILPF